MGKDFEPNKSIHTFCATRQTDIYASQDHECKFVCFFSTAAHEHSDQCSLVHRHELKAGYFKDFWSTPEHLELSQDNL